ncbi:MAG: DUF2062 domain-containing protein [Candidatus Coatesbacteria bacterium]
MGKRSAGRENRRIERTSLPWWTRLYDSLVLLNDSPGRIAGGFAIGVFVGVAPTFGVGLLLAGFLSALFRCNVAAAVVGSVAGAPPLIFLVWFASAWLGAQVFGLDPAALYAQFKAGSVWNAGGAAFKAYIVGNIFVTLAATALGYFVILAIMRRRTRARSRAIARPRARTRPRSRGRGRRSPRP